MTFFTTDGAFFAILFTIVLGFDENSTRTKAKTRAIMPDKVDKFPIHFYVVVSSMVQLTLLTESLHQLCFFLQMTYQMLRLFLILLW